jgi:hypothetical protein
MFCPECSVEYRSGFTQCVDCNVPLVNQLPDTQEDPEPPLVTVRRPYNLPEACLARAKLESENIPAYLRDEHVVGVDWFLARAIGGIRLIIDSRWAAPANEILERDDSAALEGIPESQLPPSRYEYCPSCGSTSILRASLGPEVQSVVRLSVCPARRAAGAIARAIPMQPM